MYIELSVALPIYNEESNIKDVVISISEHIKKHTEHFEILALNDGSTDATLDVLNEIKCLCPKMKVISHDQNRGYGGALRTCIKHARGEWILFMDADGQFTIEDLDAFWTKRFQNDFVFGYRKNRQDSLYRLMLGKFGNLLSNLLLRRRIKDINCGFKLVRRSLLQGAPLLSTGGLIYFEMLLHLSKRYRSFTQLPIRHFKRKAGSSTGGSGRVIMRIIIEGLRRFYKNIPCDDLPANLSQPQLPSRRWYMFH